MNSASKMDFKVREQLTAKIFGAITGDMIKLSEAIHEPGAGIKC